MKWHRGEPFRNRRQAHIGYWHTDSIQESGSDDANKHLDPWVSNRPN